MSGTSGVNVRNRQVGFNLSSREHWDTFAEHRRHVTGLITGQGTRVAILGAGNGNDLDLPAILAGCKELHLFDLDPSALEFASNRQGVASHPALHLHGGVDVTGASQMIACWTPTTTIAASELEALATWPANRVAPTLPRGFDLVASTCLLSQLMESARFTLGPNQPSLNSVERAIRTGHLRLLERMASPRGRAILITEVVSSSTVPKLPQIPDHELPGLLQDLGRDANHFRWVHPTEVASVVGSDPAIRSRVLDAAPIPPWRWRLFDRLYLVSGVTIRFGTPAPG